MKTMIFPAALTVIMGSYVQGLIATSEPYLLGSLAQSQFVSEICKGCSIEILPFPVELEPSYTPVEQLAVVNDPGFVVSQDSVSAKDWNWGRVWMTSDGIFNWKDAEAFLKRIRHVGRGVALEILGNQEGIKVFLRAHSEDFFLVEGNLFSQFPKSRISLVQNPWERFSDKRLVFRDLVPRPPCSHLLTRPDELGKSPLESLLVHLSRLPSEVVGFYQVLFQPVHESHNWHDNVDFLRDLENRFKTDPDPLSDQRYRNPPSADQRQEAMEVEGKAHNDKPFFAAAVRVGLFSDDSKSQHLLELLDSALNVFQQGGSPLVRLSGEDYGRVLGTDQVRGMIESALVFRPGFLVNSEELVGFVHVPPPSLFERDDLPMKPLERYLPPEALFEGGTPVGTIEVAEDTKTMFLPLKPRFKGTHMIGDPGVGKSTCMANMILDDIKKGYGVAVLDPHGTLVSELLNHIPDKEEERVLYFSWKDRNWLPLWNPLCVPDNVDASKVVDEILSALQSINSASWGHRIEHILRMTTRSSCEVGSTCFRDLVYLLDSNPKQDNALRRRIRLGVKDPDLRRFWDVGFRDYSRQDFNPCIHLLSKLVQTGEPPAKTFSIKENKIDLHRVFEDNMILLVDFSGVGANSMKFVAPLLFSLLHISALPRIELDNEDLSPFFVYVDEAYKFSMSHDLEHSLAENRKARVSMTFAHQSTKQFTAKQIEVLGGTGVSIVFTCNPDSAQATSKELFDEVSSDEIKKLPKYEAFVRVTQHEIGHVHTQDLSGERDPEKVKRIISASHDKFYQEIGNFEKNRSAVREVAVNTESLIDRILPAPREAFEYDVFE